MIVRVLIIDPPFQHHRSSESSTARVDLAYLAAVPQLDNIKVEISEYAGRMLQYMIDDEDAAAFNAINLE